MLRAAWDCVCEGDYIWHGGMLCAVHELGSSTVALRTYDKLDGTVANRESQHCFAADGEGEVSYDAQLIMVENVREADDGDGEVSYDAQLIMVENVREADDGNVCVAGDELLVVRAAASATANVGAAAVTAQTNHPCKTDIPNAGITDHSCVTPAHETL